MNNARFFRIGLPVVAFFLATCAAFARSSSQLLPLQNRSTETPIQVQSEMVDLSVSVTDHKGHFVSGLAKRSFRVYEDSHLQQITFFAPGDVPVTVGILVDHSGSMAPRLGQIVAAAAAFVDSSNPHDEIFVDNFNGTVHKGLPPDVEFSADSKLLALAVASQQARGETALYDAIAEGLHALRDGHGRRQALLIITDGGDNASAYTLSEVIAMVGRSKAAMYFVGISDSYDEDRNPRVLKKLAKLTGGHAYFPDSVEDVTSICRQIARDIREQYTIGYIPTGAANNGAFRKILVTVSAPGRGKLTVHARTGYFAEAVAAASPSLGSSKP